MLIAALWGGRGIGGPPIKKMGVHLKKKKIQLSKGQQRAHQVAEGHQPSAGARSKRP